MKVSVIIPCYNDGKFLKNAVGSVRTIPNIEIIIVNDGSSDPETLQLLEQYTQEGFKVLSHENHGLAYTRNRGINEAKGEYILPLDADNMIKPRYIEKGVELLDSQQYDIVYARPFFLGEDLPERKFKTYDFNGEQLFWGNYIDACAIYRKSVWESTGGYDRKMPYQGYEDWEFWINSYLQGYRFKFIDEELYGYHIRSGSMITELINEKKHDECHDYIIKKHAIKMVKALKSTYDLFQKQQRNYLKTSFKYLAKSVTSIFGR